MKKSPLAQVKETFGSKEKLVDALLGIPSSILERLDGEEKDDFKKRLLAASNKKLLKLHELSQSIKKQWGSKEKLVDALLALQKRAKDLDLRTKLLSKPLGWLHDRLQSIKAKS